MEPRPATHDTFVLSRTYPKPPQRVFAAFADPAQKKRWYAAGDHHDVEEFAMDFRVGGGERARYRFKPGTPFAGRTYTHEGVFLDIVEGHRIVIGSAMAAGDRRFSASLVTIELAPESEGTRLVCTHQGAFFEGADGPELRRAGWQKILERLESDLSRG